MIDRARVTESVPGARATLTGPTWRRQPTSMSSSTADVESGGPQSVQKGWPERPPGEGVSLRCLCLNTGNKSMAHSAGGGQERQVPVQHHCRPREMAGLGQPAHLCVCVCVCVCVWWGVIFQYDKNSTRSHCISGKDEQGIVSAF